MLLEARVWGSKEWYEDCMPRLEEKGFVQREDLGWADPETDGEFMGFYYDYRGQEPLSFEDLAAFINDLKAILDRAYTPPGQFALVKDR